ncbi:MAG TPA: SDR family oxidoreductase [Solirubrobacteraceae bacterium]|nr:SDR family oxidoreductase [Solirubrobacteraceae bacterium]
MALPPPSGDPTVLVTGASSGIGEAIARELHARGYGLILVARGRERLVRVAAELDAEPLVADLASDRSRARVLRAVQGRVVGVVNNAGQAGLGDLVTHDAGDEEAIFRTNALALFDLTNRLVRDLVQRGEGAILNVGSITAFAPHPGNATYAATKAFVQSFSEALHAELAGTGVSCTVVSPGPTRTALWERSNGGRLEGVGGPLVWQTADDVARQAVDGMVRGARTVLPGLTNRVAALGYRFTPRTLLLPVLGQLMNAPVPSR